MPLNFHETVSARPLNREWGLVNPMGRRVQAVVAINSPRGDYAALGICSAYSVYSSYVTRVISHITYTVP